MTPQEADSIFLHGIPVQVSKYMAGAKMAVMLNGILNVSPAMMELMASSNGDELEQLIRSIPVLDLGSYDPLLKLDFEPCLPK